MILRRVSLVSSIRALLPSMPLLHTVVLRQVDCPVHSLLRAAEAPGLTSHAVWAAPADPNHLDRLPVGVSRLISAINRSLSTLFAIRSQL